MLADLSVQFCQVALVVQILEVGSYQLVEFGLGSPGLIDGLLLLSQFQEMACHQSIDILFTVLATQIFEVSGNHSVQLRSTQIFEGFIHDLLILILLWHLKLRNKFAYYFNWTLLRLSGSLLFGQMSGNNVMQLQGLHICHNLLNIIGLLISKSLPGSGVGLLAEFLSYLFLEAVIVADQIDQLLLYSISGIVDFVRGGGSVLADQVDQIVNCLLNCGVDFCVDLFESFETC